MYSMHCRPMDDENVLNINNELNNIDWDIIDHLDIDDAYNVMVSQIQIALNAHAPRKHNNTNSIQEHS